MLFYYQAIDSKGKQINGTLEAGSDSGALETLQQQGLTVVSVSAKQAGLASVFSGNIKLFSHASSRDIVLLSRQISTLFEAQVSALRVFQLLASQAEKPILQEALSGIVDDIQAGESLSKALDKHPAVFSNFYVNMVRAGEESGRLDQTFKFLADYLERSFELMNKARNALIYPAFVLITFVAVMVLMLTFIIPKITPILTSSGSDLPIFTQIVISMSSFLVDYGIFLLIFLIIGGFFAAMWAKTPAGKLTVDYVKISLPVVGDLYKKIYVSRIAANLNAMLSSGISTVHALEITATVMESVLYQRILTEASEAVKNGSSLSVALSNSEHRLPAILIQMIQVGEETGELSNILERLARFYEREVNSAVDTMVSLIEPIMIVSLAVGVGGLLAAILLPIYNVANTL